MKLKSIRLVLETLGDNKYQWALTVDDGDTLRQAVPFAIDTELRLQVRGFLADPRADNAERLGAALGQTLGTCEVLDRLLGFTQRLESACIYLGIPDDVAHFPWEMLVLTGQAEAISLTMPVIGAHHDELHLGVFLNQCVLISPHCQGAVRDRTLYSSTRRLARRDTVEVLELAPPSSTSLRRIIKNGALAIHFEGVDADLVTLDDGVFALGSLGFRQNAWLVVLGGTAPCQSGAQDLMAQGVGQTLSRGFEVLPRSQAIFERSFYHALADGDCIATSVFRARNSVAQADPMHAFQSSSYVLTAKYNPALFDQSPFPPVQVRKIEDLDLNTTLHVDQLRQPLNNLREVPAHPVPLSVFVQESIQVLRGQLESASLREARKAALRRLAIRHTNQNPQESLPRDAAALRLFLEDLVGVDDHGLHGCHGRAESITELAEYVGLRTDTVTGFVHALRAHPVLRLRTDDFAQARLLVRGVAESIYGYCPRFFAHDARATFFDGPALGVDGTYYAGGGLSRTLATHWRRDETAALQPDLPRPVTRLPSLGRVGNGWHIFKGSWVVVETCEHWSLDEEEVIARAIQNRIFEGLNSLGKPFRLAVPKDFRVIFLSRTSRGETDSNIVSIDLFGAQSGINSRDRWNTYLSELFGPPSGVSEVQYRTLFIERFERRYLWLRLLDGYTVSQGEQLLGTAYAFGGEVDFAIEKACGILLGEENSRALQTKDTPAGLVGALQSLLDGMAPVTALHKAVGLALGRLYVPDLGTRMDRLADEASRDALTGLVRLLKPRSRDSAKDGTNAGA